MGNKCRNRKAAAAENNSRPLHFITFLLTKILIVSFVASLPEDLSLSIVFHSHSTHVEKN